MERILSSFRHWLVEQPVVSEFEWKEGETWGASTQFLATTVLTYLSLTLLIHLATSPPRPKSSATPPTPFLLRLISAVHNLILLVLSLIMAVGCTLSTAAQKPDTRWIFCFPPNQTLPRGSVFFWAYVFYLSKILEFIDTLLILLRSNRRLTFLHVYHHAVVVVMCYLWLHTSQSLVPVALVTNASVHTLMYGYYMLCSLGKRPPWKRLVTDCQIVQFVFSFAVSVVMLWFHFTGEGCSGIWGWCFNAVFNASLLVLFIDFHSSNYAGRSKGEREAKSS
ncbi:PREDICTED: elongation of fatty acids protein 3-like [Nelumbo nucifera]|uniref:very-long-chain 3-oxoacyl-CoA synthase n=1 Tax=Nelumbo nucifera TaxID=4432 RepID=A0A1U8AX76_NELNU|nr:PREDICTED: elongation of fatty acids protein 3-like [Nelumbo nucifera]